MQTKTALKLIAVCIWSLLLFFAFYQSKKMGYDSARFVQTIYSFVKQTEYGPLAYIIIYLFRPIIFFPAAILTLLSGALFGLWGGIVYTVIGENLSALLAYGIGAFLGGDFLKSARMSFFKRWQEKLHEQHFMTVLTMRLIYLPFDLVNYGCGAIGVRCRPYVLATFIGIMPGLITFVSFGASLNLETLLYQFGHLQLSTLFDARQIAISLVLFGGSLSIARFVQIQQKKGATNKNRGIL